MAATDDTARIEHIAVLEQLKSICAAAQARLTDEFARSQHAEAVARGLDAERTAKSVVGQVALARRESPHAARRHVGLAFALCRHLPNTLQALSAGETTEWRAGMVAQAAACLFDDDRATLDAEIGPLLPDLGDKATGNKATGIAYRLDPKAAIERNRRAVTDRRVTVRPAPDTMAYVTALLPVAQAVAVYAALTKHADTAKLAGEPRSRGQVMADELVARVTGGAVTGCDVDRLPDTLGGVEIEVIMTDQALLEDGDEPAEIIGYGPVPAALGRKLALIGGAGSRTWIRRLFTDPLTGHLTGMDSRQRIFPESVKKFLRLRDRTCRIPWCDAPIRHIDHVQEHVAGGRTTAGNGQGLCEYCNYMKTNHGWISTAIRGGRIDIRTPTGHHYLSWPPDLPKTPLQKPRPTTLTDTLADWADLGAG